MKTAKEAADRYAKVRAQLQDMPEWTFARVKICSTRWSKHEEVLQRVDGFGHAKAAWLCTQTSVRAMPRGCSNLATECAGAKLILLEAAADERSLQVRLSDRGWSVVLFEECENGADCLASRVTLARRLEPDAALEEPRNLVYRVFRRYRAGQGFVPWQARFVGFA